MLPRGFLEKQFKRRTPAVESVPVVRLRQFERGAWFEGAGGFALVLARSQMRERGVGPFSLADLPPRRNPLPNSTAEPTKGSSQSTPSRGAWPHFTVSRPLFIHPATRSG